jgi:hypothetical protein
MLEINSWGENEATIQLCANCHELFHLASEAEKSKNSPDDIAAGKKKASRSQLAWWTFTSHAKNQKVSEYIRELVRASKELHTQTIQQISGGI